MQLTNVNNGRWSHVVVCENALGHNSTAKLEHWACISGAVQLSGEDRGDYSRPCGDTNRLEALAAALGRLQHLLRAGRPTALPEIVTQTTWARSSSTRRNPCKPWSPRPTANSWGSSTICFHPQHDDDRADLYLNDLFTSPAARGKGVGRALIEAVYDRARQAGSTRVYWQTHETNAVARRLYDDISVRSGFIVYRTEV